LVNLCDSFKFDGLTCKLLSATDYPGRYSMKREIVMRKKVIFTIGLIPILLASFLTSKTNAQTEKPLTIGISYNQIMEYLDQYIPMSKSSDVRGQPRYMGQTSDNLAMLEIIGIKNDVSQATLMIGIPNDSPKILIRNSGILLRFIENIAPEWKAGSDWATSALKRLGSTGEPEEIIKGSKSIKLSLIKVLGIVSVTVKHKNAI
jgi:hypothetical protein